MKKIFQFLIIILALYFCTKITDIVKYGRQVILPPRADNFNDTKKNSDKTSKDARKNDCDCSEMEARRIANKMISKFEESQGYVASQDYIEMSIANIKENSDCSYTVFFEMQNKGERIAGWDTSKTRKEIIKCY